MDWNRAIERNGEALGRIIAVLIALAVLAERAAARSFSVRWLVLSSLRPAEAVAREFVAETARAHPTLEATPQFRNGPEDALLLAWRFRALAAVLGAFLSKARRFPCRSACIDSSPCHPAPPERLFIPGIWTRDPNDTS
jgi:hypothetical protein